MSVFESLFNTLKAMVARGYKMNLPESVSELRELILKGTAEKYGQEANVAAHVTADSIVFNTPWLGQGT